MTEKPSARAKKTGADTAVGQVSMPEGQGTLETLEETDAPGGAAVATEAVATTRVDEPGADVPTWTYDGAAADGTPHEAAASAPAPVTATPPSLGIAGRHRMPGVAVVLTIVTLGLYALVWHTRVNREMSDFDTRMHVRPGSSTWAVALPWLAGLAATVAGIVVLLSGSLHVTVPFGLQPRPAGWVLLAGIVAVPYLEFIFPVSLVAVVMTAERVRICEDRVGMNTDVQLRPAATAAWLLFPVLGGVIVLARLQLRLNGVWERVAPAASQRRRPRS